MKRTLFISLLAALLLSACGAPLARAPEQSMDFAEPGFGGGAPAEAPMAPMPESAANDEAARAATGGAQAASVERLVIQNADLSIVVEDVEARMLTVAELARELGGFVVSSNLYQSYSNSYVEVPEASIVIRVPAEHLDEALDRIKADAVEVQNEARSGQDVTAEYVDLQSRLKNLEAAETQLVRILEAAQETEDVLNVFNQLTSIREQIELVKGQIKFYEESAALSAISVTIIAQEKVQPIQIGPWTPQGAVSDAIQDLVYFWQDFVEFFIYFVLNFIPKLVLIALVYGVPLWLIVRGLRSAWLRRRAKQAAARADK
jgi:hypothetical protein